MKKYLLTLGVVFAMTSASFAQVTATLTIGGTVTPISTIAIASQAGYNTLNLVAGATAQVVGTATEISNDKLGYKVTLTSLNAGATAQAVLKGAISGNTDRVNYSVLYGGTAVTLVGGKAVVTSVAARTGVAGVSKPIAVTFAGGWLAADTYKDTLTLTIAGN